MKRTVRRTEFLTACLTRAVAHHGYGWFDVDDASETSGEPGTVYVVTAHDGDKPQHRLDLDVVAKGIGVIQRAKPRDFTDGDGVARVLANAETGERLYLAKTQRETILDASRRNDTSEIDYILALAIVECGLFGQVTYA